MATATIDLTPDQRLKLRAKRRERYTVTGHGLCIALTQMAARYGNSCLWMGMKTEPDDKAMGAYFERAANRQFAAVQRLALALERVGS